MKTQDKEYSDGETVALLQSALFNKSNTFTDLTIQSLKEEIEQLKKENRVMSNQLASIKRNFNILFTGDL